MKFFVKHKKLVLSILSITILSIAILTMSIYFAKNTGNSNISPLEKNTYEYSCEDKALLNNLGFSDKELEYLSNEEINYFTNILPYDEKNVSKEQFLISDSNVKFFSKSIYFIENNKYKVFIKYRVEFPNGIKNRKHHFLNISTYGEAFNSKPETLGKYTYSSLYCEEIVEKGSNIETNDYFLSGNTMESIFNSNSQNELIEYILPKDYTNYYYDNGIKKETRKYTNFVLSIGKIYELNLETDNSNMCFTSNTEYFYQIKSFDIDYRKFSYISRFLSYEGISIGPNPKFSNKKSHFHIHWFKINS